MKYWTLFAVVLFLTGCGEQALAFAEASNKLAEGAQDIGIPYAGLATMLTGVLAEFVRGRVEKQSLLKQVGAINRSVDHYLETLSQEDKEFAKNLMRESLVKSLGVNKADKAVHLLNTTRVIAKRVTG